MRNEIAEKIFERYSEDISSKLARQAFEDLEKIIPCNDTHKITDYKEQLVSRSYEIALDTCNFLLNTVQKLGGAYAHNTEADDGSPDLVGEFDDSWAIGGEDCNML